MSGVCYKYGGEQRCTQESGGENPEGKSQLGRLRRRWKNNIKMGPQ
jgi:hypothetical protein